MNYKFILHSLKDKFNKYGGDTNKFSERPSVIEISKILTVFHKDSTSFPLNNGYKYYYPCATMISGVTDDCDMFSICSYLLEY